MAATFDARFVAVAHQADDQLETVLMRLLRGASVRGLSAMPWRRPLLAGTRGDVPASPRSAILIRPMLAIPRAHVVAYLRELGQPWREDHTNADTSRLRARLRHEVLPLLHAIRPDLSQRTAQLTDHLRQISHLLEQSIARAADRVRVEKGVAELDRVEARLMLPVVLGGLLRRLILEAGVPADALGSQTLSAIVRAVRDTRGGARQFQLAQGVGVAITRDLVRIGASLLNR